MGSSSLANIRWIAWASVSTLLCSLFATSPGATVDGEYAPGAPPLPILLCIHLACAAFAHQVMRLSDLYQYLESLGCTRYCRLSMPAPIEMCVWALAAMAT